MNKIYKYTGTGNNGTIMWALQRISAIVLIFALGYHLIGKLIDKYASTYNRYSEALKDAGQAELPAFSAYIQGSHTFFMAALWLFVTFHAFNGLKMVTDDYVSRKGTRFILYLIYWTLALIMLGLSKGLF